MHAVEYVAPDALPPGHEWAMVEQGHDVFLFINREAVTTPMLEEAWAAYRRLRSGPLPRQRVPA